MNDTNLTLLPNLTGSDETWDSFAVPSSKYDPRMASFSKAMYIMDLYVLPILSILGILGNLVSLVVFLVSEMRHMSSSVYLAGISISDTVVLISVLFSRGDHLGWNIYHRPGLCQLFVYFTYVASSLSVLYCVSFSVERCIAVTFPLKRKDLCTPERAKTVTISLAVVACILYTFALWTSNVIQAYGGPFCSPLPKYYSLVSAINNVDTTITLIIPTILIVGSNIQIGYALAKFNKTRSQLGQRRSQCYSKKLNHSSSGSGQHLRNSTIDSSSPNGSEPYNKTQMKVTRMLLTVSTVFLTCNIPSHAIRIIYFIMSHMQDNYQPSHSFFLIQKLFQFLYYLNFSINFVLYAISGRTFRLALTRLVQRIKHSLLRQRRDSRKSFKTLRLQTSGGSLGRVSQKTCEVEVQESETLEIYKPA